MRFHPVRTLATLLCMAVASALLGFGPFALAPEDQRLVGFLAFLAFVAVAVLLLTAVFRERNRAETLLRQSEQRFYTLAENSTVGFWHITPQGHTLYINPALCKMLQLDGPEDLAGQTFHRYLAPDALERVRAEHNRRHSGEASAYEVELVGARGGRRSVLICGVPVTEPDGGLHSLLATVTDVTELKQTAETLRTSRQMLQQVLDNIPLGVCWKDTHCVFLGCNDIAARIAGLAKPSDIVGKTDFDLPSTDEEAAHFQRWDRRVMLTDTPEHRILEPLHRPDGGVGWLNTTKVPLHDDAGQVSGVLVVFEDITDRKRLEEALRDSERRFRALIEHSWDGISVVGGDGRLIYRSPSAGRIMGEPADADHLGEDIFGNVHPEDLPALQRDFARLTAASGQMVRGEYRARHHGGGWLWLECVATNLLCEPGVGGLVVNFRDVTERRLAEEVLRENEERLRLALDTARMGTWDWDLSSGRIRRGGCHHQLFGLPEGALGESYESFASLVHDDDRARVGRSLTQAREGDYYNEEYRVVWPDGSVRWVADCGRAIDVAGPAGAARPAGVRRRRLIGVIQDVTDRKHAEEAERLHQEQMRKRQAREKELVEAELARVRAEVVRNARLAALGQVAASIAHELRNPLGVIRNAVYYLRRKVPPTEPTWADYLTILDHEVSVSDRIIGNLLELSRGKEPVREAVEVAALVRDAFRRALTGMPAGPGGAAGVTCRLNCRPEPLRIHADRVQLRQVVDNLLKNALEALAGCGEIAVDATCSAGYADIVVTDSGPGVALEHRTSLFEPLFSTKAKGTGLGLYVSRQIVERHGGTLELLESGTGTAFRVRLAHPESQKA